MKNKGRKYEERIAKMLTKALGLEISRVPRSGALSIKGDIKSFKGILKRFNFELKYHHKLNIWDALEQASRDAEGKIPALIFSRDSSPDYVTIKLDDFIDILMENETLLKTINLLGEKS